jgi:hypothetical protein
MQGDAPVRAVVSCGGDLQRASASAKLRTLETAERLTAGQALQLSAYNGSRSTLACEVTA